MNARVPITLSLGVGRKNVQYRIGESAHAWQHEPIDARQLQGPAWGQFAANERNGSSRVFPLPPVVLGSNGHIYTRSTAGSWVDAATPPVTLTQITGSMPYTWAVAGGGEIYYGR